MRVGAQENRIDRYFNDRAYPNVAVLDFKLNAPNSDLILKESLELVAGRATYSLREILGIIISLGSEQKRKKENAFSRENAFVCSTFVQHLYLKTGIHFNREVSLNHITPEDIFNTQLPCKKKYSSAKDERG